MGEPGASLPRPVALITSEPGFSPAMTRSLSSGVGASTYSTGTPKPSASLMRRSESSRAGLRFETTTRDGRSSPRSGRVRYQVMAIVEPPAPMEKSSAPVRAK